MRLLRWFCALAIAAGTGASAGSAFSFYTIASINRGDPFLVGIGWLAAAVIAVVGLAAISGLFPTTNPTTNPHAATQEPR